MTHDEMIAVIQAHKEGKKIEVRGRGDTESKWLPAAQPCWDFFYHDYRVAPAPVEVWANVYPGGGIATHPTEANACEACGRNGRTILLREVTE